LSEVEAHLEKCEFFGGGAMAANVADAVKAYHAYNKWGYGPARLDQGSTNPDAIKGREQMLIDHYLSLGIAGNYDLKPLVTNRESCIQQAIDEFGPLP
jgi:hypothetical protein